MRWHAGKCFLARAAPVTIRFKRARVPLQLLWRPCLYRLLLKDFAQHIEGFTIADVLQKPARLFVGRSWSAPSQGINLDSPCSSIKPSTCASIGGVSLSPRLGHAPSYSSKQRFAALGCREQKQSATIKGLCGFARGFRLPDGDLQFYVGGGIYWHWGYLFSGVRAIKR